MKNRRKEERMMQKDIDKQLNETKVRCEICGREFNQITWCHLKMHGMTLYEYKDQFPDVLLVSEGYGKRMSEATLGIKRSEETKQKMRKPKTELHKQHISEALLGNTYGKGNKGVPRTEETRQKISDGHLGMKASEESKQKIRDNMPDRSGKNNPMYGLLPWNFGLTKETNESVKKYGEKGGKTFKAFYATEEGQQWLDENRRGENAPMSGKKHTEESKQLIKDNHADNSGEKNGMYGKRGDETPNYKGGISNLPYCEKFDDDLKERVRNFFDRKCYVCGKTEAENGQRLSVHHVNYNKMVCCNDVKPLFVPLCRSCHGKTQKDREYWEEFFTISLEYLTDGKCFLPKKHENIFVKNKNRR